MQNLKKNMQNLQAVGFVELLSDTTVRLTELFYTGVGLLLYHSKFNVVQKVPALIGLLAQSL